MTYSSIEARELDIEDLGAVTGGDMPFFGAKCSLNQNEAIGGLVKDLGSIPIVGGVLAGAATIAGWIGCGGLT
jgi:hypothetical protein